MPVTAPNFDNQKCLHMLPRVPWGDKNHPHWEPLCQKIAPHIFKLSVRFPIKACHCRSYLVTVTNKVLLVEFLLCATHQDENSTYITWCKSTALKVLMILDSIITPMLQMRKRSFGGYFSCDSPGALAWVWLNWEAVPGGREEKGEGKLGGKTASKELVLSWDLVTPRLPEHSTSQDPSEEPWGMHLRINSLPCLLSLKEAKKCLSWLPLVTLRGGKLPSSQRPSPCSLKESVNFLSVCNSLLQI